MKNIFKALIIMFIALIVCIPMQTIVKASTVTNMDSKKDVVISKTWTVSFNKALNASTVNATNVKVLSDDNTYIETKVSLASDDKSLVVEPVNNYEYNKTYKLIVTNQVQSSDGKALPSEVRMDFTTINAPTTPTLKISSIPDITGSVTLGGTYSLPKTVTATMSNGSKQTVGVTWPTAVTTSKAGTTTYYGVVSGAAMTVKAIITVNAPIPTPIPIPTSKYKIVLDAGHGEYDSGAIGPNGVYEKTITLAITLKVGSVLVKNNVGIVYTRTTDSIPYSDNGDNQARNLQYRCDVSNLAKPNYFVCIHADSFVSASAHGTETYTYVGSAAATKLAQAVQTEIVNATGSYDRGLATANYYVLKNTDATAILIETGFVSNPVEDNLLVTDAYQNKVAKAIATGILKTLGITNIIY